LEDTFGKTTTQKDKAESPLILSYQVSKNLNLAHRSQNKKRTKSLKIWKNPLDIKLFCTGTLSRQHKSRKIP